MKGRRLRGEALLAQERLEEAETELTAALAKARELGNPAQLWRTHAVLGRLYAAQGRAEQARRAYREALAVVQGVAERLRDRRLRGTLLNSVEVTAIQRSAGQPPQPGP